MAIIKADFHSIRPAATAMIVLWNAAVLRPGHGPAPWGEHECDWEEVLGRFGWTARRRQLLDGLAEAIELLGAAGCRRLWLDGSFVTTKDEPADFDACWDTDGIDMDALAPVLLDLSKGRAAQKARFGGEFLPNVVETGSGLVFKEFFQNERDVGVKASLSSRSECHDH
ncbi:MAG: hypothetical protein GEV12_06560 [Micromonosporaceae bacterium]|nr:hypothetical protein [Micromonosporaceae bacterium]